MRRLLVALLALLPFAAAAQTGSATLSCNPPTTNTDGSPLTNLESYRWWWGTSLGVYTASKTTASSAGCGTIIDGLTPATWFFAVTAISAASVESPLSNPVSKVIPGTPVVFPPTPTTPPFGTYVPGTPSTGFRFVRWTITGRRGGANSVQVADLELMLGGVSVPWPAGTTAENPGGNNPSNERAPNLVDNNAATKALDFNFSASLTSLTGSCVFVVTTPAGIEFDGYRFRTANDLPERDPVAWTLEASQDGGAWALLAQQTAAAVPTARGAWTQRF